MEAKRWYIVSSESSPSGDHLVKLRTLKEEEEKTVSVTLFLHFLIFCFFLYTYTCSTIISMEYSCERCFFCFDNLARWSSIKVRISSISLLIASISSNSLGTFDALGLLGKRLLGKKNKFLITDSSITKSILGKFGSGLGLKLFKCKSHNLIAVFIHIFLGVYPV